MSDYHDPQEELDDRVRDPCTALSRGLNGLLVSTCGAIRSSVGQDAALGYYFHDAERVELFVESFTFMVLSPEAAVRLMP